MTYATPEQFAERSGLGLRQIDETVGTGAGTATAIQSFDLDKDNIIEGTYTLSHAPSGSNNFTELTETTHYTVNVDSGRVLTTGTGAGEIGDDTLYATYYYIDSFSGSVAEDYLSNAEDQVDKLTGKKWDSATFVTEYQDGRRSSEYPTTDRPFMGDWDQPDHIVLKKWPVTKVDQVFFLANGMSISKFFNNENSSGTFADHTDNVNSTTTSTITLFDSVPATSDKIYIGSVNPFLGLDINLGTDGTGSPAIDWEYYNGSAWVDITETDADGDTGASVFTTSGKFTWTYPAGWSTTSINSSTQYWIRGVVGTGYTIAPICNTMTIKDSVDSILEPRQITFRSNGIIDFMNKNVPSGQQNLRIDYYYGMATTPGYITELAILIASVQAFINLSGGSYDDATSYTVGSKSVTIGEVYVNIREVLAQQRKRIETILNMIGARGDIKAI